MSLTAIGGIDALRILCGVFLIPHMVWDLRNPQQGAKIYDDAGIGFSRQLFLLSLVTEGILATCLIFGILPRWAGALGVAYLGIAAAVMWKVTGRWLWNFKGVEFLIFWACCCLVVALWQGG